MELYKNIFFVFLQEILQGDGWVKPRCGGLYEGPGGNVGLTGSDVLINNSPTALGNN